MAKPSSQRLADALRNHDPSLNGLADDVLTEKYHDFWSPLVFPRTELVYTLVRMGKRAFAQRVLRGEFAATREEADEWLNSQEAKDTFGLGYDAIVALRQRKLKGVLHEPSRGS